METGTSLGPYEILSSIGAGGSGKVYRARDTKLGRDVAIKVLSEAFSRYEDRVDRFDREAKMLASLNRPGIATLFELDEDGDRQLLVIALEAAHEEGIGFGVGNRRLRARRVQPVSERVSRRLITKVILHLRRMN